MWAQLKGIDASDGRLMSGISYQALEAMDIDTGWVQRILNEMCILNVADPAPYDRGV